MRFPEKQNDNYKLDSGESDFYECENCDRHFPEDGLEEVLGRSICSNCKEKLKEEEFTICPYCYSESRNFPPDGVSVCSEDCGIIEGSTISVNAIELEKLNNGDDLDPKNNEDKEILKKLENIYK